MKKKKEKKDDDNDEMGKEKTEKNANSGPFFYVKTRAQVLANTSTLKPLYGLQIHYGKKGQKKKKKKKKEHFFFLTVDGEHFTSIHVVVEAWISELSFDLLFFFTRLSFTSVPFFGITCSNCFFTA